jgi:RNA polymerase sigma factor (sigma-70 family)
MEQEFWKQFQQGNNDALSAIYTSYFDQLYNYGFRFTNDATLVEDSIQELFIKLMRNRNNLAVPGSVKAYLFTSIRFQLFDKLSQSRKTALQELNETTGFTADLYAEPGIILNEEENARNRKLKLALDSLTPRQREAVFLKYQEGLSYPEIADMLSLTQKATYKLIARAIQNLKSGVITLLLAALSICPGLLSAGK